MQTYIYYTVKYNKTLKFVCPNCGRTVNGKVEIHIKNFHSYL